MTTICTVLGYVAVTTSFVCMASWCAITAVCSKSNKKALIFTPLALGALALAAFMSVHFVGYLRALN